MGISETAAARLIRYNTHFLSVFDLQKEDEAVSYTHLLALHILLLLVILCITKHRHNFPIVLLPQYGHLRVITSQNAGIPIYFVIFFHIRLSSRIRERLASAHGLLPGLFFLVVVLFVAHGDLLLPLLAEGFFVAVPMCGGSIPHGISVLIALQRAAKPDQIVRKTTMPTSVPSKIRASQISTDSAVSKLGGETESSFFFPACFSSALIWATSRASASSWDWVGSCPA